MKIKKETKYTIERKGELQKDAEEAADVVKAGTKAVFNKLDDSYRDFKAEYRKEKVKEKL